MLSNCGDDDETLDTVTIRGSQVTTTEDSTTIECLPSTAANDLAGIACLFYDESGVVVVGEKNITITSTNEPDHKSMYYESGNPLYEEYSEPENEYFKKNPNTIAAMNYTFTIPRFPEAALNNESTPFGPMGVSINSVVFYNQVAAPGDDILEELNTCLLYTSPSPRDATLSRMPSSA